mmetsp:Transcript_102432/g.330454  ORF Transcript_102432/g.330454 Transcript_102432/m.330454 type:complete len:463 (-) Transcript_102432:96-1484(-)
MAAALQAFAQRASQGFSPLLGDDDEEIKDGQAGTSADINIDPDIYGSVLAAAFGGLTQNLKSDESMKVHPFMMFLLCVPLFVIQVNAIVYLHLDQVQKVITESEEVGASLIDVVPKDPLLTMKLLMVLVLQLMLFGKLMSTLRNLVFVLNPTTWTDIDRPNYYDMKMTGKFAYRTAFLCPWVVLALLCRFLVIYQVCIDSVSIILMSDSTKDAIFDSLAITFLSDLGDYWWPCVSTIFHFDRFDNFNLLIASNAHRKEMRKRNWIKIPNKSPLHRGQGARSIEMVLTFTILFIVYSRQLMVIFHALDSNIPPIARDVCTAWRWQQHKSEHARFVSLVFRGVMDHVVIVDPAPHVEKAAIGLCDGRYNERFRMDDSFRLLKLYPKATGGAIVALFVSIVVPQIFFSFNTTIRACFYRNQNDFAAVRQDSQTIETTQEAVDDFNAIKIQLEDIKAEIEKLKAGG